MILKEMLEKAKQENLIGELIKATIDTILNDSYETYDENVIQKAIETEMNSLLSIGPKKGNIETIVCIQTLDYNIDVDENMHYRMDKGVQYIQRYDVSACLKGKTDLYSIIMADWKEVLLADVLDTSIQRYGFSIVLANILYELSWHGITYENAKKNAEKFEKELDESVKEFEKNPDKGKVWDDSFRKELGLPIRDEKEEKFIHDVFQYIQEEYEKEKKTILGQKEIH